jgi:hypothetical protein
VRLPEREGLLVAWRSQRRVSVSLTSRDWLGLHVAPDQWSDADREAAIRIVSDFAEEHGAVGIVLAVGYRNAVYASGAVQDDPLC